MLGKGWKNVVSGGKKFRLNECKMKSEMKSYQKYFIRFHYRKHKGKTIYLHKGKTIYLIIGIFASVGVWGQSPLS